jgi:hypothetical protein
LGRDSGQCPYCNEELIHNEGLKYSNILKVTGYDNQIILVCNKCIRHMYEKGELKEVVISEYPPGSGMNGIHTYEFFKNSNT